MKTFGEKLKYARMLKKLTQEELSSLCGISVQSIIKYEKEKLIPRASTIHKLAEALEVSEEFLTNENIETPTIEDNSPTAEDQISIEKLLEDSKVLLAGGKYSMEDKEKFIEALTLAYYACKAKARNEENESPD